MVALEDGGGKPNFLLHSQSMGGNRPGRHGLSWEVLASPGDAAILFGATDSPIPLGLPSEAIAPVPEVSRGVREIDTEALPGCGAVPPACPLTPEAGRWSREASGSLPQAYAALLKASEQPKPSQDTHPFESSSLPQCQLCSSNFPEPISLIHNSPDRAKLYLLLANLKSLAYT